jgi:hypothetical protein
MPAIKSMLQMTFSPDISSQDFSTIKARRQFARYQVTMQ